MRISRIKVNNFKSLVEFDLPMEKFTCLIGLNGSGKSTVLQFPDVLGQLMKGELRERDQQESQSRSCSRTPTTTPFRRTKSTRRSGRLWRTASALPTSTWACR